MNFNLLGRIQQELHEAQIAAERRSHRAVERKEKALQRLSMGDQW